MSVSRARPAGLPIPAWSCLLAALLLTTAPVAGQESGSVAGRVVDDATGQPVPALLVRVAETQLSALTDDGGRFRIAGVPSGLHTLLLVHLAYGEQARAVVVTAGAELSVELRIEAQAVALDSLVVEAPTEVERRRTTTGFAMNEVLRPAIDRGSQMGLSLGQLLQAELLGVRVRAGSWGPHSCVEYRGTAQGGGCREVSVFLDGVPVTAPSTLYSSMPISDIERLEVLSPGQAGALYGSAGGNGVLLIETRSGVRPDGAVRRTAEDLSFGFDWAPEESRYPWERVAMGSLVANALGLGVSVVAASRCFEVRARGVLGVEVSRCNAVTTMFAGFATVALPSILASYTARWAGETERSRGRILPGVIVGTLTAAGGYLVLVRGESGDSDGLRTIGALMLTVTTPTLLTLSDRLLRVLR